jgi:hypothetical protein
MYIPENVLELNVIRYNAQEDAALGPEYRELQFLPFQEFIEMSNGLASSEETEVALMSFSMNGETFEYRHRNDRMPRYYTELGNQLILFDSYNSTLDDTLKKSKTMCTGVTYPTWTDEDSFIPDLDPATFPYLLNRAKVRAFVELKQMNNSEAERTARRQQVILQKRDQRVTHRPAIYSAPRYGRK